MPQAPSTDYFFPVPGAARLASLIGLMADMEQVVRYCGRMIERYTGDHLKKSPFDIVGFTTHVDSLDWEALSTAACICYARCFVSGVRQSLDPNLLKNAEPEHREMHAFILALRNKHVAHSVNSFEENSVTVQLGREFQSSQEIQSVVPRHSRTTGISIDTPTKLQKLAQWWLVQVRDEMSREQANVLLIAQSTPLDVIRGFAQFASHGNENSDVSKRRRGP